MTKQQWKIIQPFIEKWQAEESVRRAIAMLIKEEKKLSRNDPPFPRRF